MQIIEADDALDAAKQAQEGIIDGEAQTYLVQEYDTDTTYVVDLLEDEDSMVFNLMPSMFEDKNNF